MKKATKAAPASIPKQLLDALGDGEDFGLFCATARRILEEKLIKRTWSAGGLERQIISLRDEHEDAIGTPAKKAADVYLALQFTEVDGGPGSAAKVVLLLWSFLQAVQNTKEGESPEYAEAKRIYWAEVVRREKAGIKPSSPTLEEWQALIQKKNPGSYKKKGDAGIWLSTDINPMLKHWRRRMTWDLLK